ncbi:uncharacterized protein [Eucyclogobius newberryi]|uniref:uncharacterized protein n=1 Tax=Eucyclogobius newberryi TaxID=166745 RepID=UPI003B5ABEE6
MSKGQTLRALVNKRLTAAAEEIFALVERTIAEYEEELCRSKEENQRKQNLLDCVLSPQVRVQRLDGETRAKPGLKRELADGPRVKAEPEERRVIIKEPEVAECSVPVMKSEEQAYFLQQTHGEHKEHTRGEDNRGGDISLDPATEEQTDHDDDWATPTLHQEDHYHQVQSIWTSTAAAHNSGQFTNNQAPPGTVVTATDANMWGSGVSGGQRALYECSVCPKRCSTESALLKHVQLHTGENPNTCVVCKKTFNQANHLKTHMRIHTGEKPYSCSICHKAFGQKGTLDVHWRTHTGERPFSCFFCHKGFIDGSSRKRHMRIHTGERPYACSHCGRGFNSTTNLKSHIRSQHYIETARLFK